MTFDLLLVEETAVQDSVIIITYGSIVLLRLDLVGGASYGHIIISIV